MNSLRKPWVILRHALAWMTLHLQVVILRPLGWVCLAVALFSPLSLLQNKDPLVALADLLSLSFGGAVNIGRDIGELVGTLIAPLLFGVAGGTLIAISKRSLLRVRGQFEPSDVRAPVVFLRAFDGDKEMSQRRLALGRLFSVKTEEEQLAEALREIGPLVAIGRPGEFLPQLGASRVYINGDRWRDQVLKWFRDAALVVIRLPRRPSEGIAWEISSSLESVRRDRLIFLICDRRLDWHSFGRRLAALVRSLRSMQFLRLRPANKSGVLPFSRAVVTEVSTHLLCLWRTARGARGSLVWLNEIFQKNNVPKLLLAGSRRGPYRSSIASIVYFDASGRGQISPLIKPPLRFRTLSSPLVRVYRLAFAPVIRSINGTEVPLSKAHGELLAKVAWSVLLSTYIGLAVWVVATLDPFDRQARSVAAHLSKDFSESQIRALTTEAMSLALSRLSDTELDTYVELNRRLLQTAKDAECGALAKGTLPLEDKKRLLRRLSQADPLFAQAWMKVTESLIRSANMSGELPNNLFVENAVSEAAKTFFDGMSAGERARFEDIENRIATASVAEVCWHARRTMSRIGEMPPPFRSTLARYLLRK